MELGKDPAHVLLGITRPSSQVAGGKIPYGNFPNARITPIRFKQLRNEMEFIVPLLKRIAL